MSEQELNSYRFVSGAEPTDDQLAAIMQAALDDVKKRAAEAKKKYNEQYERLYAIEYSRVARRIINAQNGIF